MSSTWWHIPALVATIAVLSYALVQLTIEPESVQKKRHAMHLLTEVQAISDSVMAKLTALEHDVQRNGKESEENDVPLNSYYHFDSTGKKLKTKWDTYDVEAELNKLDQDDESNSSSSSATKSSTVKQSPKFTKSQLLSRAVEIEHEFEAILSYLDTIRGDDEVRVVRKQLVGAINDTYLPRLDAIKEQL